MDNVNVEQIMKGIRKQIKKKGAGLDIPAFDNISLSSYYITGSGEDVYPEDLDRELEGTISKLKNERNVSYYYPMASGINSLIKKIIRKTIHCVFVPILDSQNQFNSDVVYYLRADRHLQSKRYKILLERLQKLEEDNHSLRKQLYVQEDKE